MPIIDIQRRLVEVGRIRMGKKQGNRPVKLDTWRLTSSDKARLEAAAELFGGKPAPWKDSPKGDEHELITETDELPIMLLPGQALSQYYELWSGGGCQRRCDGEQELISGQPCLCGDQRECKPTTRLSVMLPDVPGLGCWRLESHGYYAAVELSATALMLETATARGQLLPARLRIDQRRQVKGGQTTRYAVPVIDIDIRFRDAVGQLAAAPTQFAVEAPRHTPIAALPSAGVTVEEGLALAEQQSDTGRRRSAPMPVVDDVVFGDGPVPVTVTEPTEMVANTRGESSRQQPESGEGGDRTGLKFITERQRKRLFALAKSAGLETEQIREFVQAYTGQDSTAAIPVDAYEPLCAAIQAQEVKA